MDEPFETTETNNSAGEQPENFSVPKENEKNVEKRYNQPGRKGFLPGNPGKPKGSKSLKNYIKEKLANMPDEEKETFLADVSKELQWRMGEGNPSSDDKLQSTVKIIIANEADEGPDDNPEG